jgi:hypothetical protein
MDSDDNLIDAIAPNVLRALENKKFFHLFDAQMCPEDPTVAPLSHAGSTVKQSRIF